MASTLLSHEVSDLCIGKPPLRCLSVATATVADAITALKSSDEPFLTVWSCNHDDEKTDGNDKCECLGKICMADVICYLSKFDNNVLSLSSAFDASVSVLIPKSRSLVVHVHSSCKLIEAIDLIIQGAQNLIVPIQTRSSITKRRQQQKLLINRNVVVSLSATTATTHKNGLQFCWITQEDIIRFLLDSISVFSPLPSLPISDLGVINSTQHTILAVDYYSSAASAVSAVSRAILDNVSVAVVDKGCDQEEDSRMALIGEISPMTLACCDETAAAAVATLSAGDLMTYIDGSGPPESLVGVVRNRLEDKGMVGLISLIDSLSSFSGSSSDDESSPAGRMRTSSSYGRSVSSAARMARKSVAIVCNRKSSLMAVMIQAIAHRVSYVWVVDEDGCLIGMVTFVDIFKLFREFLDGDN
ncbi:PREDICTED: CBS domain-containing protein CBSX5 [Camelina sativa]|uniref:CBS domain-containing protein CBSX5 n=1 Tax=Camelina sativa TaxID=90675 RepID=A0ABM0ULK6_CAMSA|nr:PREDICTED: CBS domain-containing protein CBSX5 [Camelina sativa]